METVVEKSKKCPVYIRGKRDPLGFTDWDTADAIVEEWKLGEWYKDGVLVYDFVGVIAAGLA